MLVHPLTGPLGFGITPPEALHAEYLSSRQKALNEFGKAALEGVNVRRMVCRGDPAQLIVERARAERSDLIVMPTHGHGALRRFLLGSVTAKVLHDAECPVWTGTHLADAPAADPAQIRHVMCAVNFGPQSQAVIQWAADFASEFGADLTIVHSVLETPPNLPERYMFQWHEEAEWGTQEQLRTLLLDSGIKADAMVASDADVTKAICSAAQQKGADVLVIGRSCARDRKLGTHTYAIICQAPCPVVSV
jgi:nucleotide-binding universal stress UspA family protein